MFVAIVLGIVEGATEFLPVSSTGHLVLVGSLLKFTGEKAGTFEVFIQLGAIFAGLWLYKDRFTGVFGHQNTKHDQEVSLMRLLVLTTLPALIIGFLFHDVIKQYLFNVYTVAFALGIGGVIIILFEIYFKKTDKTIEQLSSTHALMIGVFQALAVWPGVSRSAATIIGGISLGLDRKNAVEYSFLAAVPLMFAATGYDLLKSISHLTKGDIGFFAVGFVTSFIAAVISIKFFTQLVQKIGLKIFGFYRIVLAFAILIVAAKTTIL